MPLNRFLLSTAIVGLATCLPASSLHAQTVSSSASRAAAAARGQIVDSDGLPVPRATIVLRNRAGGPERFVESGQDGRFVVQGLRAGVYDVTVLSRGFAPAAIELTVPQEEETQIRLEPAPVIEEVRVVSASRQDELREALNTRVDVVTRARIEESGAETVGELLRELPGVLTRRGTETAGAAGEQIQGIDSRQVLVLMDGQPLVGARGIKRGAINLDRQSTGQLERVEVVKGASSALYGSDAIGGVINLITREPDAPVDLGATIAGGSLGDRTARGEVGVRHGNWWGLFVGERRHHDGFDLTPSTWDTTGAPFRRTDGMGKAHLQLSPDLALSGTVNGYRNRTTGRSNGELGPQEDDIVDRTVNAGVSADWRLRPTSALQVRAYHARYDEESTGFLAPPASTPLDPGALRERLSKLDASFSQVIGSRQQLQVGAEWWHNTYDGINRLRNDEAHEATTGVLWGQHRLTLHDRVTTTLGLRVDSHSEFGTAVSPKIAANARLTDVLRVRASAGRGFRAPDLGQLYYRFLNPTNFYQVIGNPNLDPEYANSYQLGGEFTSRGRRARLGVNLFRNDVRDLIESVSLGFVATPAQLQQIIEREGLDPSFRPVLGRLLFVYRNVSDVVTQGVELDGDLALARGLEVGGAYTWLDARDEENDVRLTGRHAHQGHVRLGWTLHRLGLRANLRGTFYSDWPVTRVTDSTGSTVETIAPSFALWDAFVSMPVVRGLDAFLSIENLADSQDPNTGVILPNGSPAAIYRPDAGRTFRIGVRWNWHR